MKTSDPTLDDALLDERFSRNTATWWKHDATHSPHSTVGLTTTTEEAPPVDDDVTIARRRRELREDFDAVDGRIRGVAP